MNLTQLKPDTVALQYLGLFIYQLMLKLPILGPPPRWHQGDNIFKPLSPLADCQPTWTHFSNHKNLMFNNPETPYYKFFKSYVSYFPSKVFE